MPTSAEHAPFLTGRRILRFWLPLEATWLMMAFEGPFLAAVIARLPAPEVNLAAFGVASALAWIVESPIIMMLSASNTLCRDRIAYHKLRRFSFTLNGLVTAVMMALVSPPVFSFVVRGIMGLPSGVAAPAGRAIVLLVFWPAAIGFRRFYQGILIRNGRPQAVTWGTVIRLSTMAVTGLLLNTDYSGHQIIPRSTEKHPEGPIAGTYDLLKWLLTKLTPTPLAISNLIQYLKNEENPSADAAIAVTSGLGRYSRGKKEKASPGPGGLAP